MPDLTGQALSGFLQERLGLRISGVHPVQGGDINEARKLETDRGTLFLKFSSAAAAVANLAAEARGLQQLDSTNAIRVPAVIDAGSFADTGFLVLEFVDSIPAQRDLWKQLGSRLAALHCTSSPMFGLDQDNFIGALPQSNNPSASWVEFYLGQRLMPQWLEASRYFDRPYRNKWDRLVTSIDALLPEEAPALIHGDLWSGNFMFTANEPVLIDPAISFASREMDIAMSMLFGGFDRQFYTEYNEAFPLLYGWEDRIPLYQLYYLLVHVNLFGTSYVPAVSRIIDRYAA